MPAIGLVAGLCSGLLGVGGGIVMVPLLVALAHFTQKDAQATSLLAILPIALVGAAVFAVHGEVAYGLAGLLAAGSLVGAPVGARIMAQSAESTLKITFAVVMIVVAITMFLPRPSSSSCSCSSSASRWACCRLCSASEEAS